VTYLLSVSKTSRWANGYIHKQDLVTASATKTRSQRRPRYLNPFEGRKKPINLSGLFLFDPEVSMRLQGQSVRTTFIAMGEESLFKGLERASRTGQVTKALRGRFLDLLPPATAEALAAAFDSPDSPTNGFAQMGMWEAHILGALRDDNGQPIAWPASAQFLCDIERASRQATILFDEGQFQAAAQYVVGHSLLRCFMSPESLNGLAQPLHPNDRLTLRTIVAMEIWLSLLALWDTEARLGNIDEKPSYVLQLLTQDDEPAKNSVARLFDWLLKASKVESSAALIKDPRLKRFSIQIGTLGAWSRGTNFPSASYGTAIAKALLSDADKATFKVLTAAARQLNFLGHVGQHIDKLVSSLEGTKAEQAKHLGLGLPFGHDNIETWMRCRYPVWLQFHRVNLAGLAPASSPAAEP
jgi:hypothetical protein